MSYVSFNNVSLPFCGRVLAGWESPAEEELSDSLTFEEWLIPKKESSFLVHVSNDSLKVEGINTGDVLIVEKGRHPKRGNIVVAEIDGTNRLLKIDQPIPMRVLGVVSVVIRKYF